MKKFTARAAAVAVAIGALRILEVDQAKLDTLLHRSPRAAKNLLMLLAARLRGGNDPLSSSRPPVSARAARIRCPRIRAGSGRPGSMRSGAIAAAPSGAVSIPLACSRSRAILRAVG